MLYVTLKLQSFVRPETLLKYVQFPQVWLALTAATVLTCGNQVRLGGLRGTQLLDPLTVRS